MKIVGCIFQIKVQEASLKTFTNWIHQALIEENLKKFFEIDIEVIILTTFVQEIYYGNQYF